MLKFYWYAKCDTCRRAKKWLEAKGKKFEAIDITLDAASAATVAVHSSTPTPEPRCPGKPLARESPPTRREALARTGASPRALARQAALVTGALAFSAQETLGNLWGGIAIQLEKTCRIGDWVRIADDKMAGAIRLVEVVGEGQIDNMRGEAAAR